MVSQTLVVIMLLLYKGRFTVTSSCLNGRIDFVDGNEQNDIKRKSNIWNQMNAILLLPGFMGLERDPYNITMALNAAKAYWLNDSSPVAAEAFKSLAVYRICNPSKTTEVVLSTILDTEFMSKSDGKFKVILYISYLDIPSTRIASQIVASENVYLVDMNIRNYYYNDIENNNIIHVTTLFSLVIYFIKVYSWRNIAFLNIGAGVNPFDVLYIIKEYPDLCISIHNIIENDIKQIENVVNNLKESPERKLYLYIRNHNNTMVMIDLLI